MNTITLIDSYTHIYRGFYALPHLSNSKGFPTNAIFAFAKTLLYVEKNFPSSHGAAVFDKGKSLQRLKINPDYKATRPPMPPELQKQIPYIRNIAEAFGWFIAESENTEADDIIASICAKFPNEQIFIVSNDKDLAQLVKDNIHMLSSSKDGGLTKLSSSDIISKFSVTPDKIVDYLSLVGDNSDNIKGAPGIGPKTAVKLLCEYSSLENLLANVHSIQNEKIKNSLLQSKEQLFKNKEIIRLSPNPEIISTICLDSIVKRKPDINSIKQICNELELKSILAELNKLHSNNNSQEIKDHQQKLYEPDLFGNNF